MRVVSNTSPLIFLAKINKLDFLRDYQILIPEQVFDEIEKGKDKGKEDYLLLESWIKKTGAQVKKVVLLPGLPKGLGDGEKAAISLSVKEKVSLILLDERKARATASLLDLTPRGTLAIVRQQMLDKKITRKECRNLMLELVKKGYRIKKSVWNGFIAS